MTYFGEIKCLTKKQKKPKQNAVGFLKQLLFFALSLSKQFMQRSKNIAEMYCKRCTKADIAYHSADVTNRVKFEMQFSDKILSDRNNLSKISFPVLVKFDVESRTTRTSVF